MTASAWWAATVMGMLMAWEGAERGWLNLMGPWGIETDVWYLMLEIESRAIFEVCDWNIAWDYDEWSLGIFCEKNRHNVPIQKWSCLVWQPRSVNPTSRIPPFNLERFTVHHCHDSIRRAYYHCTIRVDLQRLLGMGQVQLWPWSMQWRQRASRCGAVLFTFPFFLVSWRISFVTPSHW